MVVIQKIVFLPFIITAVIYEPCAILCNIEPEEICSLLQNSLQLPKFLWSQIYFLLIFIGVSG
jgi:hypothetical protein